MSEIGKIIQSFIDKGISCATAESCTGGLIASEFTKVPGVSAVYGCGVVTYSNEMKEKLLKVPHEILERYGAVSPQTAEAMVRGLRELSNARYCAAVTGIAGPGGGSPAKPVGLVYTGILKDGELTVTRHLFKGDRDEVRRQTVEAVFAILGNN